LRFAVYVLSNAKGTLYVGVTNDLRRRVFEHKHRLVPGFTRRYHVDRLVYFEMTPNVRAAIEREKQIKGWRRSKKITLIEARNPDWRDLSNDWTREDSSSVRSSG
jgi:putative endonuclease